MFVSVKDRQPAEVDWVSGAFFMFKRSVVERIGMLREDFFMYAEDMEFCYRAKKEGFRVWYDPTVDLVHLYGKCSTTAVSKVDFQSLANVSAFFKETHGRLNGWVFDLIIFFGFLMRAGIYSVLCALGKINFESKKLRCMKLTHVAWQILSGVKTG